MKSEIRNFVSRCSNCQQFKAEHQGIEGLTQSINIPTWNWEDVNMYFMVGLTHILRQHDSILVVVDTFIE